MLTDTLPMSLS